MSKDLRFFLINAENLFIPPYSEEFISRSGFSERYSKDNNKSSDLAKAILEMDPQFILLSEVGGLDSLDNFNERFLENKYISSLIEGNSDRGIDIGFLIKKDLPFRYEHLTHRNRPLKFNYPYELNIYKKDKLPTHYLSRDIAELRVFKKGADDDATPLFIVLHVHLKSQLDQDNKDTKGRLRRAAELELLIHTYQVLNTRFKGKVPIFLTGDFNGSAQKNNCDEEFKSLYKKTKLQDILEIMDVPESERTTLIHFSSPHEPNYLQFDYIFMPENLKSFIDHSHSGIYRYKDKNGMPMALPTANYMKNSLPSDHYPILLTLSNFLA